MGRTLNNEVPPDEPAPADDARTGRVVVDARGRNVWQWAKAALDSTSILLKRLENQDLALEPTQKVPIMPGADSYAAPKSQAPAKQAPPAKGAKPAKESAPQKGAKRPDPIRGETRRDTGGGFDPYNTR